MENEKIIALFGETIQEMASNAVALTNHTLVELKLAEALADCFPCTVSQRFPIKGEPYLITVEIKMRKI